MHNVYFQRVIHIVHFQQRRGGKALASSSENIDKKSWYSGGISRAESSASPGAVPDESLSGAIIAITKYSAPGLAMAILKAALDIRVIRSFFGSGVGGFGRTGRQ